MDDGTTAGWAEGVGKGKIVNETSMLSLQGTPDVIAYQSDAPGIQDARVEMDITFSSARCQFGLVFRYENESSYAMIYHDDGKWFWENGSGDSGTIESTGSGLLNDGPVHVTMEYEGSQVSVWTDGTLQFSTTISRITNITGKNGLYSCNGSKILIDNIALYPLA